LNRGDPPRADEGAAFFLGLERRLMRPKVRRSAAELKQLLAEDFVEFGSSGRRCDRDGIIASLAREETAERSIEDFSAREIAQEAVLVTYVAVRRVRGETAHSLRSSIWRKTADRWQMIFHQGTMVP